MHWCLKVQGIRSRFKDICGKLNGWIFFFVFLSINRAYVFMGKLLIRGFVILTCNLY